MNVQFESDEEVSDEAPQPGSRAPALSPRVELRGPRLFCVTRSRWEVGMGSGWALSARKERRDYFRCRFLALGGFVDYLANPGLIVSQYDGKQMVVFRSLGET